jgi:hypothetical protein
LIGPVIRTAAPLHAATSGEPMTGTP